MHTVVRHVGVGGRPTGILRTARAKCYVQHLPPLYKEPGHWAPTPGLHLGLYQLPLWL